MATCNLAAQHVNALITAQNHGTILVMVAWFLTSLLALCTAIRIISRCQSRSVRQLSAADDIVLVAASLCGLGTTIIISTATDVGLGKRGCLLTAHSLEQIQVRVFVSTILFVLALSVSKCSILVFLHRVADNTSQRVGLMIIGVVVLIWTFGALTGIIFECEMPRPWEIWTGKCIPMVPFWITITVVDIVIDVTVIVLSMYMVWSRQLDRHERITATLIFSLRILLIAASCIRLGYLRQAFSPSPDPTLDYVPYAIVQQSQSTLSIIISCALALKPVSNLLHTHSKPKHHRHSKHWSGSTIGGIGGKPYEASISYESYKPSDPFGSTTRIIAQEPLHTIQGSMSTPTSPAASRKSLIASSKASVNQDILLPEITMPLRYQKVPPRPPTRPPPPCERDRPDLSMFTKTTVLRDCPAVTTVAPVVSRSRSSERRNGVGAGQNGLKREKSARELGLIELRKEKNEIEMQRNELKKEKSGRDLGKGQNVLKTQKSRGELDLCSISRQV